MFRNLNLRTKFTLLLSLVFLVGIALGGVALWQILQRRTEAEITSKALLLIETMSSVRRYTSQHVGPLLQDDIAMKEEFTPESVPAFSARTIFDSARAQNEAYAGFFYKEATLNPTNPVDQADGFETEIVLAFRNNPGMNEVSDFRTLDGKRVFYIARPMVVSSESCLQCHSTPEVAPASLTHTYGTSGGFGWSMNEIIAAQIIYVPAEEVQQQAQTSFLVVMSLFVIVCGLVILVLNALLRMYVISPVTVMGGLAQKMSHDADVAADLEDPALGKITARPDELGQLAAVFQRMAREVHQRMARLKHEVTMLRIEVDEIRQKKQVEEIVDTEFFNDLQSRAQALRRERQSRADAHAGNDEPTPNPG